MNNQIVKIGGNDFKIVYCPVLPANTYIVISDPYYVEGVGSMKVKKKEDGEQCIAEYKSRIKK